MGADAHAHAGARRHLRAQVAQTGRGALLRGPLRGRQALRAAVQLGGRSRGRRRRRAQRRIQLGGRGGGRVGRGRLAAREGSLRRGGGRLARRRRRLALACRPGAPGSGAIMVVGSGRYRQAGPALTAAGALQPPLLCMHVSSLRSRGRGMRLASRPDAASLCLRALCHESLARRSAGTRPRRALTHARRTLAALRVLRGRSGRSLARRQLRAPPLQRLGALAALRTRGAI